MSLNQAYLICSLYGCNCTCNLFRLSAARGSSAKMIQRYQTHITSVAGCTASKHTARNLHLFAASIPRAKTVICSVNINMRKTVYCYGIIIQVSAVTAVITARINGTAHRQAGGV